VQELEEESFESSSKKPGLKINWLIPGKQILEISPKAPTITAR
jgi:hypothetical protein